MRARIRKMEGSTDNEEGLEEAEVETTHLGYWCETTTMRRT